MPLLPDRSSQPLPADLGNRSAPFSIGGEPVWNFAGASTYAESTLVKEVQSVATPKDVP